MMDRYDIRDTYYSVAKSDEYTDTIGKLRPYLKTLGLPGINTESGPAKTISFQVTEDCNLRCKYCYQINKSKKRLSFETAKKFIDIILSEDESKSAYVNKSHADTVILDFIGGEPLLEINLIDQIVDYFIKRCIELDHPWIYTYMISIDTNGTLYFLPEVQNFIEKHAGKVSVSITVDGSKALHDSCRVFPDGSGSYDMAAAAVRDWSEKTHGANKTSKLTIAPGNVMYLKDAIIDMVENLGFDFINENCVYEDVWNIDLAKILYEQLKGIADYFIEHDYEGKVNLRIFDPVSYRMIDPSENNNWCGGDGSMAAVNANGEIFNCIRYMGSSLGSDQSPLVIGDVDNGIACKKDHCDNLACMQCITRRSQSTDECFYCPIGAGCGWCSAYNYQMFGTPNKRTTTTCLMHRAASLAAVYYWNKVLQKHGDTDGIKVPCPKDWAVPIIGEDEYNMIIELAHDTPFYSADWYAEVKYANHGGNEESNEM